MKAILTSILGYYEPTADGGRRAVALKNVNGLVDVMRGNIPSYELFAYVANDPNDSEDNDAAFALLRASLEMAGLCFMSAVLLDGRNKIEAKILSRAGLVVLRGGKCAVQNDFLREIGAGDILARSDALVLGVSAGAMNMGATVANFPEESSDLPDPRFFAGCGLVGATFIPHFDCGRGEYIFPCDDFDIAKDYILPMSKGRVFLAADNDGFIFFDGKTPRFFGSVCKICDGKIEIIR